jgi:release factor glutamine methyltransferase
MRSDKIDLEPVKKLLEKHSMHASPYEVSFKDMELVLHPDVFNPTYTKVSGFLADNLDVKKGEVCLEMFSGSGALSLLAGTRAKKVVGIDISALAIEYSTLNSKKLNLDNKVEFRNGNMWEVVGKREKFDFIFANPPLLPVNPESLLEMAVADSPEMKLTREFISGAARHLKSNGRIYMALSNACQVYVGDPVKFMKKLASESNLSMKIKDEWDVGYEVYRIIDFRPKPTVKTFKKNRITRKKTNYLSKLFKYFFS